MYLILFRLFVGREICQKSILAPVNSLIFEFAQQLRNFVYVVADTNSKDCILVDACWDVDAILKHVRNEGLNVVGAIATHRHVDHVGGLPPKPYDRYGVTVEGLNKLLKKLPKIMAYVHPEDIPGIVQINPDIPTDRLIPTDHLQVITLPLGDPNASTTLQFYHTPGKIILFLCMCKNEFTLTAHMYRAYTWIPMCSNRWKSTIVRGYSVYRILWPNRLSRIKSARYVCFPHTSIGQSSG